MSIRLHKSRLSGATPAKLIKENINLGLDVKKLYESKDFYYKDLKIAETIGRIIRDCNGTLGASGKIKNGCLYREYGLPEIWTKDSKIEEICDHAIPVTTLVKQHLDGHVALEKLIFSPVVRLSKIKNDELTRRGYAKKIEEEGISFPLHRYKHVEITLITHLGETVDPATWTDEDHWRLVKSTKELEDILHELKL
ncbi:MAG: hypothetical protein IPQ12_09980 [Polaromonas sp.]|nr:hypothetical protein [Polaromonas sp.]